MLHRIWISTLHMSLRVRMLPLRRLLLILRVLHHLDLCDRLSWGLARVARYLLDAFEMATRLGPDVKANQVLFFVPVAWKPSAIGFVGFLDESDNL